jgi:hypothetical protein
MWTDDNVRVLKCFSICPELTDVIAKCVMKMFCRWSVNQRSSETPLPSHIRLWPQSLVFSFTHETSYTCAWCKAYIREELISNTSWGPRNIRNDIKGRRFLFSFTIPYEYKYDHIMNKFISKYNLTSTKWAKLKSFILLPLPRKSAVSRHLDGY